MPGFYLIIHLLRHFEYLKYNMSKRVKDSEGSFENPATQIDEESVVGPEVMQALNSIPELKGIIKSWSIMYHSNLNEYWY